MSEQKTEQSAQQAPVDNNAQVISTAITALLDGIQLLRQFQQVLAINAKLAQDNEALKGQLAALAPKAVEEAKAE